MTCAVSLIRDLVGGCPHSICSSGSVTPSASRSSSSAQRSSASTSAGCAVPLPRHRRRPPPSTRYTYLHSQHHHGSGLDNDIESGSDERDVEKSRGRATASAAWRGTGAALSLGKERCRRDIQSRDLRLPRISWLLAAGDIVMTQGDGNPYACVVVERSCAPRAASACRRRTREEVPGDPRGSFQQRARSAP